jgi:hypothetical protein
MTNSKWFGTSPSDPVEDLLARLSAVESYANDLERKIANFDSPQPLSRVDPISYQNPFEGQRAIDPADEQHMWYSNGEWRKAGGNPVFAIKVFEDDEVNIVKDRAFVLEIPEDLDGGTIIRAGAFITTAGGDQEIDITHDGGASILDAHITIPAGDLSSLTGHTATCNTDVAWGDQFSINTIAADGMGLGVWIVVMNAQVGGALLQGLQGEPGGVTQFQGAWTTATGYVAGDVVVHNNVVYLVTADHTSGGTTEPGVGVNWEDFLAPLIDVPQFGAGGMVINGNNYVLDTGLKGWMEVPYDGTITAATLLADAAGNIVVDVWKTTYSGFPGSAANSITGGNPLTLTGANKTKNTTLTGWTTAVTEGDIIYVNVVSASVITKVTMSLKVARLV